MASGSLIDRLAELREERGLTQEAVASLMGTTQPVVARLEAGGRDPRLSTIERYAAALDIELVTRSATSSRRTSVGGLASRIRARLERGDESATATFREVVQFVDDAVGLDAGAIDLAIRSEPVSTGDRRWDALLAATADWLADGALLPRPRWTGSARRVLAAPGWFVTPSPKLHRLVRASTPPAFADHGVFVDGASLESV